MIQVFTLLHSGISSLSLVTKGELGLKCAADCVCVCVWGDNVKEVHVWEKSENLRIGEDCNTLAYCLLPQANFLTNWHIHTAASVLPVTAAGSIVRQQF